MMAIATEPIVVDSRYQLAARCLVCGNGVDAGQGVTAEYQGRTLRFKCPGCYARFAADPDRYLAAHEPACCNEEHGGSPASEWRCD
jgi:YHS domain-containing protein